MTLLNRFEIVSAGEKDLPQILKIENVSFPRPFSEEMFRTELRLDIANLLVAKREGRVVGYIDFWDVGIEIHLLNIAVDPSERRQGTAKGLMERMITHGKKKRALEIFLDVRVSNQPAITLYENFGFEKVGLRTKYYEDNKEDALLMRLKL